MTDLVTMESVQEQLEISNSTLRRLLAEDDFPQPIYLTPRKPRFKQEEVDKWVEDRAAAT